jgi:GNAT superfamily N-acetyltransferase
VHDHAEVVVSGPAAQPPRAGTTNQPANDVISIDGTALAVRPIALDDVERLSRLFTRLSPESVHYRFFSPVRRLPRSALLRLADVDHERRDALVALDGDEIVAVARYDAPAGGAGAPPGEAEIAVTVEDAWQHRGVGKRLSLRLARLARERGYERFNATMLGDNRAALGLVRRLSPDATVSFADGEFHASIPLRRAS